MSTEGRLRILEAKMSNEFFEERVNALVRDRLLELGVVDLAPHKARLLAALAHGPQREGTLLAHFEGPIILLEMALASLREEERVALDTSDGDRRPTRRWMLASTSVAELLADTHHLDTILAEAIAV